MCLSKIFYTIIGYFPLIGPDGQYEADLILNHSKPVCLLVDKHLPAEMNETISPAMERIRHDINRLDESVGVGSLKKRTFETVDGCGIKGIWNFYCHPEQLNEMQEFLEQISADIDGREPTAPIAKDYGEYFGYSKADIRLFSREGYRSYPSPLREIFEFTHTFRVKCRVATKLGVSPFDLER